LAAALAPPLLYLGRLVLSQNERIFRPGPRLPHDPADYAMTYEAIRLETALEPVEAWWLPQGAAGQAILFFHGSDGNLTHELATLRFLVRLPANVLAVEYPGYGGNGRRPSEAGCYRAAEAAWRFVTAEKGFSPGRVIAFGHSLGGAVAAYLAERYGCGGLVIQSGFTSVPDMAAQTFPYLPARPFVWTKMNSLARLKHCHSPLLILHSTEDEHIPVGHAERLYRAGRAPKKLVLFQGSHWGSQWQRAGNVQQAWRELLAGELGGWTRQ
jgi:pimeloyl-ACP methyl ester carboxylesterase